MNDDNATEGERVWKGPRVKRTYEPDIRPPVVRAWPAFVTPTCVRLRMQEPGEVITEPVLWCEPCRRPHIHDKDDRRYRCRACGMLRIWGGHLTLRDNE